MRPAEAVAPEVSGMLRRADAWVTGGAAGEGEERDCRAQASSGHTCSPAAPPPPASRAPTGQPPFPHPETQFPPLQKVSTSRTYSMYLL